MDPFRLCRFIATTLLVLSTVAVVHAQAPASLTEQQQHDILSALMEQVEELYVFPDSVDRVRAFLQERAGSGAYRDLTVPAAFGQQVTADLRDFTRDRHFAIAYDPEQYREMETMFGAMEEGSERRQPGMMQLDPASPMAQRYRSANFFFRTAEVLDGNIGYLKIDQMPPLDLARSTVDAAMAFLARTDAMILDLRGAPGGVGGFIPYLMSYFFPPEPLLLYSRDFGAADSTAMLYTHDAIGGARRPEVPLFILTDGFTGSAAENLAYTVQQHSRATVVGAVTAGAAHSAGRVLLVHGFTANIPMARVIHPVSQSNWERVGVQPDVPTASTEALPSAHRLALDTLLAHEGDPRRRQELESARQRIEEVADPPTPDAAAVLAWEVYAGSYGARRVFVEDGELKLQREGGPALPLRHIEGDRFRFELPPGVRSARSLPEVDFRRDTDGAVMGLAFIQDDGSIEEEVARDS